MVMPYSVRNVRELADLKPGAYVDFTLVVEKGRSYVERISIHRYENIEREPMVARRLQLLEAPHAVLKPGDAVPDFHPDRPDRASRLTVGVGRESGGGVLHPYQVPAARLLLPGLQQLRSDKSAPGSPHGT